MSGWIRAGPCKHTGGSKWLRLLVHVSLCSMLFDIAPDRDPNREILMGVGDTQPLLC